MSAGVLDLEIQQIVGTTRYRLLSPAFVVELDGKPAFKPDPTITPDGKAIVNGTIASYTSDRISQGVGYMPVPSALLESYNVATATAVDRMLASFPRDYQSRREPATLGPLAATHVVADGGAATARIHLESWLAWDPEHHVMYAVQVVGNDIATTADAKRLHDSFVAR